MKKFISFLIGAIVGAGGAYYVLKKDYDKRLANEIENVKEYYEHKANELGEEIAENVLNEDIPDEPKEKHEITRADASDVVEYLKMVNDNKYTAYENMSESPVEPIESDDTTEPTKPFVIKPDEFGQGNDNDVICLTYYAKNDVLADDADERIYDVENAIGDALKYIGEYEPDIVYVRNNGLHSDFEISRVNENWEGDSE